MGFDLPRLIPSILIAFLVFTLFGASFISLGQSVGTTVENTTIPFNNTLTEAQNLENKVLDDGTDTTNTFFPAISALYSVWLISKAAMGDFVSALNQFGSYVGLGGYTTLIIAILIAILSVTVAWIILAWLFKQGGSKER